MHTGGYCFFPKSRSKALKIFEIEPVLSIRTRAGVCAKVESVVTEVQLMCNRYNTEGVNTVQDVQVQELHLP